MITIGIDAGMETVKVVVLENKRILAHFTLPIGIRCVASVAFEAVQIAVEKAKGGRAVATGIGITGSGAEYIPEITDKFNVSLACAKGVELVSPETRTLISIGADSFFVLNCRDGIPSRIARNDLCAAGTGRYLWKVAQLLQLDLSKMGEMVEVNGEEVLTVGSICAVFAETEIISLIHSKKRPEEILAAVYNGVVSRIMPVIAKVNMKEKVAVIGGVARNTGVVKTMEKRLKTELFVPQNPEIIGALGAALLIQDRLKGMGK